MAPEPEIRIDEILERAEPKLVQPRRLVNRQPVVWEVRQRIASPHRKRIAQLRRRELEVADGQSTAARLRPPQEAREVERLGRQPEGVPAALGNELDVVPVPEQLAQLRHIDVERVRRRGGW